MLCPFCRTENKVIKTADHMICYKCKNSVNIQKDNYPNTSGGGNNYKQNNGISLNNYPRGQISDKNAFRYNNYMNLPRLPVRYPDFTYPPNPYNYYPYNYPPMMNPYYPNPFFPQIPPPMHRPVIPVSRELLENYANNRTKYELLRNSMERDYKKNSETLTNKVRELDRSLDNEMRSFKARSPVHLRGNIPDTFRSSPDLKVMRTPNTLKTDSIYKTMFSK
jgi:hypothetical protein